jgi:hypothetical protein
MQRAAAASKSLARPGASREIARLLASEAKEQRAESREQ